MGGATYVERSCLGRRRLGGSNNSRHGDGVCDDGPGLGFVLLRKFVSNMPSHEVTLK